MSFLKSIDIFGTDFRFLIKEEGKYKTSLGGILTILVATITLISCWYFGQDIYLHNSPSVFSKVIHLNDDPVLTLNSSNIFFAFLLQDDNNEGINDKSYFVHNFVYYAFIRDKITKEMKLTKTIEEAELCNLTHIDEENYNQLKIKGYYCKSFTNLKLGGNWDTSDAYYILKYSVDRCSSDTEKKYNLKCKSEIELRSKYRDKTRVVSFIQKPLLDPNDYKNPIHNEYEYNFETYDVNSVKENRIFYSNSSLTTDDDWIFSGGNEKVFTSFDSITNNDYHVGADTLNSWRSYVHITKTFKYHNRIYIKIPEIIAVVGGLLSVIMPFITIFFNIYLDNHLNVFLFRNLYEITEEDDRELIGINHVNNNFNNNDKFKNSAEEPFKKRSSFFKKPIFENKINIIENNLSSNHISILNNDSTINLNLSNNSGITINNYNNSNLNNNNSNINNINMHLKPLPIDIKKTNRKLIEISCWESFKFTYLICFNKYAEKYQIFGVVNDELKKKIDIIPMLTNIDKLDKLKKILLNKNQIFMLENKNLKVINQKQYNDETIESYEDLKKKLRLENINELLFYLKKRSYERSINDVDKLLLADMENELKSFIIDEMNMKNGV